MQKHWIFKAALAALALLAVGGCNRDWDAAGHGGHGLHAQVDATSGRGAMDAGNSGTAAPGHASMPGGASAMPGSPAGFADLPDRGDLVGYPHERVLRRSGAHTWHRADISEAHALRAIFAGVLNITTPSGERLKFQYERHVEHPSGDWTWVGKLLDGPAGQEAILTFGAEAVFGSIGQPDKAPLQLMARDGASWLIETDRSLLASVENSANRPDFLIPPPTRSGLPGVASDGSLSTSISTAGTASATTAATTMVDVLIGYTPGFATAQGGASAAMTRINYLVEVTNQAYVNSQVDARVRLVHAMQVNYTDLNSNETALEALTGNDGDGGSVAIPAALQPLRNARETYGADLVSLVRDFQEPEHDGCGIAWLIGGGLTPIQAGHEFFGYSVVSDGTEPAGDGKTYYCRDETLAHEFGHNMGSAHDLETAKGDDGVLDGDEYGRYSYSFGYKTGPSAGDFYTIMAYGDVRESAPYQTAQRVFSNPRIFTCGPSGNLRCGNSDADNARSLTDTIPIVATFRNQVVQAGSPLDLFVIKRQGRQGTEVHVLDGGTSFQSFSLHAATALHRTGSSGAWKFRFGDYNRDGVLDLYVIKKTGSSGRTEVHILNGADRFRSFFLHVATALHQTGDDESWVFDLGDYNGDGHLDLYVIKRNGSSGRTEVHVLNGANRFQSFLLHVATALHSTGNDHGWKFELADYDNDGAMDLYVIKKQGSSGFTELHVMDGANRFRSYLLHRATALHATGTDNSWDFKLGDYDEDGAQDIFVIQKQGSSGRTQLHVLDGASSYRAFSLHEATALHETGTDGSWEFDLGVYSG